MPIPNTITLRRPDDWHVHLRDGALLAACAVHTASQFARAIIMPNLVPPVTKVAEAAAYRARIRAAVPADLKFEPLMTCYLTDGADPAELSRGKAEGVWVAAKLYPAHATTNSAHGVTSMDRVAKGLEAMEKAGMPLLVHGEVTSPEIDLFDREAVFIERHLIPLRRDFPELKIVMEHITTQEAAQFVAQADGPTAATITAPSRRCSAATAAGNPFEGCAPIRPEKRAPTAVARSSVNSETDNDSVG